MKMGKRKAAAADIDSDRGSPAPRRLRVEGPTRAAASSALPARSARVSSHGTTGRPPRPAAGGVTLAVMAAAGRGAMRGGATKARGDKRGPRNVDSAASSDGDADTTDMENDGRASSADDSSDSETASAAGNRGAKGKQSGRQRNARGWTVIESGPVDTAQVQ